jgi:hypothetical protein
MAWLIVVVADVVRDRRRDTVTVPPDIATGLSQLAVRARVDAGQVNTAGWRRNCGPSGRLTGWRS